MFAEAIHAIRGMRFKLLSDRVNTPLKNVIHFTKNSEACQFFLLAVGSGTILQAYYSPPFTGTNAYSPVY
jgi:hypothetical protein